MAKDERLQGTINSIASEKYFVILGDLHYTHHERGVNYDPGQVFHLLLDNPNVTQAWLDEVHEAYILEWLIERME